MLFFTYHNSFITVSAKNTAAQESAATVTRLFSKYASKIATTKPTTAETVFAVEEKMAGMVITVSTAYGI